MNNGSWDIDMNRKSKTARKTVKLKQARPLKVKTHDADPLNIKSLSVQRNGKRILSNVNWQIRKGENWVVLGSNGSGKTTMLSTLLGILCLLAVILRCWGNSMVIVIGGS